jgi:uncharacterized protein (TIGR02996 family)
MTHQLCDHPTLRSLLEAVRSEPHEDAPRLVLADWLEEHGECARAEFVRLQLLLAPGLPALDADRRQHLQRRCRELLDRHGGCWLGRLQNWLPPCTCWHRGLLTPGVPRRYDPDSVEEEADWIDTLLFRLTGRDRLRRAALLLARTGVNHAGLDLRNILREQTLLEELACVPERPNLRSLSIDWPLRLLAASEAGRRPKVGVSFLQDLLSLPLARHLTHLGSSWPFDPDQTESIRKVGVEPQHARYSLWMHETDPCRFRLSR